MPSIFDSMVELPTQFTPDNLGLTARRRSDEVFVSLRDPLNSVFTSLSATEHNRLTLSMREKRMIYALRDANHYYGAAIASTGFINDSIGDYPIHKHREALLSGRTCVKRARAMLYGLRMIGSERYDAFHYESGGYLMERIVRDVEMLLINTMSYLDSLYDIVLRIDPVRAMLSNKTSESFGKFCDWYEKRPAMSLQPPLSHLAELVPWAQTIRKLRDNLTHNAHPSAIFLGERIGYLPQFRRSDTRRVFPDTFYLQNNPNSILDLEKMVVYFIVPAILIRQPLAEYFASLFSGSGFGFTDIRLDTSLLSGPGISSVYRLSSANQDVLL